MTKRDPKYTCVKCGKKLRFLEILYCRACRNAAKGA